MTKLLNTSMMPKQRLPLRGLLASILLFLSSPSQALEFFCSVAGDERFIRLELPGEEHLCEVTVTNQSQVRSVMWYADHDSLFCSAKAYELRDKYIDQWNFKCTEWPDTDGIDKLSERQRSILDTQLKKLIEMGSTAKTRFSVSAVKTAASTAASGEPGIMALQFFIRSEATETESDLTYVIADNGEEWSILSTIDTLATLIDQSDEYQISAALVSGISDSGALEIMTSVVAGSDSSDCQGSQVIHTSQDGAVTPRTPHRYVCG